LGIAPLQLVLDQPYITNIGWSLGTATLVVGVPLIWRIVGSHFHDRLCDRDLRKSGVSEKDRAKAARQRHAARLKQRAWRDIFASWREPRDR
jgi:hypothetical protein